MEADHSNKGLWIGLGIGCVTLLGFGCVVLFIGFFVLGIRSSSSSVISPPSAGFSAAAWAQGPTEANEYRSHRCGMIGALESEVLYFGMPRTEVEQMLGQPDDANETDTVTIYHLGHCVLDFDSYIIEFDESDTVIDYRYSQG